MSGHNKWSKIKHKKAAADSQKSKVFSKYAHLIAVESKRSAGDTNSPTLKSIIEKARSENMPIENIERAVARGAGLGSSAVEEAVYETYGPGGAAVIALALTDNRNRTAAEIKHLLSEYDTSLAAPGSAMWAFSKNEDGGYIPNTTVTLSEDEKTKLEQLVSALEEHGDIETVYTNVA